MGNTEAEVGLEFNQTDTTAEIPQATAVAETLVEAVTNPNNTFNLTVEANSIQVVERNNSTTAMPTVNTTATIAATTTTIAGASTTTGGSTTIGNTTTTTNITITTPATIAATTTTATPTNTTSVPATTTTAEAVTTRQLTFRSVGETFTSDLQDTSSAAFTSRASLIKSTLEPFYQQEFPSFRSLNVVSFSNGSIINNMDIGFASTSVPNNTQIANVLVNAASNITTFNVDTASISVDGTQVSSGVSHKSLSLITASCLVLMSWLLSSQQ
ncbi:cell wall integrity and stress response component 4-like [Seriola dumerili]|uniref:cell wall integrity and stress response component 4-like n=1 Tax=Seriola dumerili TaxID=41447 RepID=UPI000BBEA2AA|nr:cell wall integrity and stress response component 4-like [Seriola dumerili]